MVDFEIGKNNINPLSYKTELQVGWLACNWLRGITIWAQCVDFAVSSWCAEGNQAHNKLSDEMAYWGQYFK